mgnify:FL=1
MSVGSVTNGNTARITNVAPGNIAANSTDAINGSQLYQVIEKVGGGPDTYVHFNDGSGTQGAGNATYNSGKINEIGGATGSYSMAIGRMAIADHGYSSAIGNSAEAKGTMALAVGYQAVADNENSIAIGYGAKGNGKNSASLGVTAWATKESSLAIGNFAQGNGVRSIAIGASALADADESIAIGMSARARGKNSLVVGNDNDITSTATNTTVIGTGNGRSLSSIKVTDSGFFGNKNNVSASGLSNIHIVGNNSQVESSNSIALGTGIVYKAD